MDKCELRELVDCVLCGSDVSLGLDCAYAMSVDAALCFSCAVCRGGVYDDSRRSWIALPDLSGLPTPRSPSSAPKRYWVQRTLPPPPPSADVSDAKY
ncbi:MAG: hypothetical protein ABW321_23315 [Polyangiales bacterium]